MPTSVREGGAGRAQASDDAPVPPAYSACGFADPVQVRDMRVFVPRDDDVGIMEDRFGEDQPFPPRRRVVEEAEDLALAASRGREALVPAFGRVEHDLEADPLRDELDEVGRDALVLAVLVDALERLPVRIDAHPHRLAAVDIGLLLLGEGDRGHVRRRAARRLGAGAGENQGLEHRESREQHAHPGITRKRGCERLDVGQCPTREPRDAPEVRSGLLPDHGRRIATGGPAVVPMRATASASGSETTIM